MYGASIFSDCSDHDDNLDTFKNEFLTFIQTDEKEKLQDINLQIIYQKQITNKLRKSVTSGGATNKVARPFSPEDLFENSLQIEHIASDR